MKTLPIATDKAPASTRQVLKNFQQNLDGQFSAEKMPAEKCTRVFQELHAWCEALDPAHPKLTAIPVNDLPTNVRPILKTFHETLQAAHTPLDADERTAVITCIEDWCAANQTALGDSAGKGAGA
jgi:hypothetical protein